MQSPPPPEVLQHSSGRSSAAKAHGCIVVYPPLLAAAGMRHVIHQLHMVDLPDTISRNDLVPADYPPTVRCCELQLVAEFFPKVVTNQLPAMG